jgi:hypothetical protein
MWASKFLTKKYFTELYLNPINLFQSSQDAIFHNHVNKWVLLFCQIGLVDNLSKDTCTVCGQK